MSATQQQHEGPDVPAGGTRRVRLRGLGILAGGLALACLLLGSGFLLFAVNLQSAEVRPSRHADALVVLTGGADRVSDAIDLLATGQADRMLITGVNPQTSPESLARRLPRIRSFVDCCVTFGYRALDTAGNASETAAWVRAHRVRSLIVVTSNYHMPRALAEIGRRLSGVDLLAYPVVADTAKDRPWWASPHRLRLIASEYLKYLVVLGWQTLTPVPTRGGEDVISAQATLPGMGRQPVASSPD